MAEVYRWKMILRAQAHEEEGKAAEAGAFPEHLAQTSRDMHEQSSPELLGARVHGHSIAATSWIDFH
jgi:hypothetical protein